jgi:hypothetical protein
LFVEYPKRNLTATVPIILLQKPSNLQTLEQLPLSLTELRSIKTHKQVLYCSLQKTSIT